MKLAIVGATGMVGRTMLEVINERNIDFDELHLVASASSRGKIINFKGNEYSLITLEDAIKLDLDYALFSAGGQISKEWAPKFSQKNTVVIDNSSAWRMDKNCPLVVPQINQNSVGENKIIANPNCSTIQMVLALSGLHKTYKIKRLVISTYQSVSGTGKAAVQQMQDERIKGVSSNMAYFYPIDQNCIPHCDVFLSNGYTKEEMKLVHETRKILNDPQIQITRDFCDKNDIVLIEDCAHIIHPSSSNIWVGDYLFFSPHKHFPVKNGSILYSKNDLKSEIIRRNMTFPYMWYVKNIAKKTLLSFKKIYKTSSQEILFSNTTIKPTYRQPSFKEINHLDNLTNNLLEIIEIKKQNFEKLKKLLESYDGWSLLVDFQREDVPYIIGMKCCDIDMMAVYM